jgi:hypothetical protein
MFSLSEFSNTYFIFSSFLSFRLRVGNVCVRSKSQNGSSNYAWQNTVMYSNITCTFYSRLKTLNFESPEIGILNFIWIVWPGTNSGSGTD